MKRRGKVSSHPIPWLPIDSRLIPPLFSFGHVHGMARLFLEIEMLLAVLVVAGTLIILGIKVVGF